MPCGGITTSLKNPRSTCSPALQARWARGWAAWHAGLSLGGGCGQARVPCRHACRALQSPLQQQHRATLAPCLHTRAHLLILCTLPTSSSSRKGRNTTTRNVTLQPGEPGEPGKTGRCQRASAGGGRRCIRPSCKPSPCALPAAPPPPPGPAPLRPRLCPGRAAHPPHAPVVCAAIRVIHVAVADRLDVVQGDHQPQSVHHLVKEAALQGRGDGRLGRLAQVLQQRRWRRRRRRQ